VTRPEDKPDSPEYKKKQAMIKGPVLELAQENAEAYGMQECTFTGLKDLFTALIESNSRTGVLSPQRFLEIFKRDNEMFRNSMHQDAHEFYGLVLNDVIANVEANARRMQQHEDARAKDQLAQSLENALGASTALMKSQAGMGSRSPGTGWVHDIFEGVLTSETKCLTCETASQRDETFLDLSIDLEEHSSVTSCLRKFSAEEMLCERNKFHCDHCGGLQEAEKRMKIKRLPRVLALHLKRFKYSEDYSRLNKLFHRVVYPYHLRMFNTTDDAEDPDRLYELYAVVVHIGGNAYHGHYVAVIKTPDRGWLLFDDEMVEPVDKHFVRNFFGDKPGMACAYVLFYQETTEEKVREEQDAEGLEEVKWASEKADLALGNDISDGVARSPLSRLYTNPVSPMEDHDLMTGLEHARTAQGLMSPGATPFSPTPRRPAEPAQPGSFSEPLRAATPPAPAVMTEADKAATEPPKADLGDAVPVPLTPAKTKEDKKELRAQDKARKAAEKERLKQEAIEKAEAQKEAARRREENFTRMRENRKREQEEMQKVIEESKRMAAEEERRRKAEAVDKEQTSAVADTTGSNTPAVKPMLGLLNRANRGSKSLSRKSFGFLSKGDKGDDPSSPAPDTPRTTLQQNGSSSPITPIPDEDKPLKRHFSFAMGRKKSGKFAS
jgi:ubiquitin carboxyl-terminal hydrolase 9/13